MIDSSDIRKESYEFINLNAIIFFDDQKEVCAIILSGSMDTQPVLEFREKLKEKVLVRRYDYLVDLSRVMYMSSTGLGLMMFLAAHKKNTVYLLSPHKSIAKPIKILGIHRMFKFYDSLEQLKKEPTIPHEILRLMEQDTEAQKDIHYDKRWMKILRDYLTFVQITEEAEKITPYLQAAEKANSIALPSDEKYTCVLYKFLEKVFRKKAQFDTNEIDDATIEIIAKELMTNAVRHGYDYKKEGVIEAVYEIDSEKLEINVIDYGKGVTTSPDQVFPHSGLEILKKIFDKISVSKAPKKEVQGLVLGRGTMVKMIKYRMPQI